MRAAFDDVARRQLGLVTTKQLAERGWTPEAIRHAVNAGWLRRVEGRPGVLAVAGAPASRDQAWLAAVYGAGEDHLLAELTATRVWGLERFPDPPLIDLLTTSTSRARLQGVRTHRTIWLPPHHRTRKGALPVTTPARTFVDACGEISVPALKKSVNNAMRRGILGERDLARVVDEVPRSGRRKSRPIREVVSAIVPGYDPGDSDAELDIVDVLVAGGYPRPQQQIEVKVEGCRYSIDVGYQDIRHGFEFRSEKFHFNRLSFHDDPMRVTRLQRAGWKIWPVTSRTARAEILLTAAVAFGHLRRA